MIKLKKSLLLKSQYCKLYCAPDNLDNVKQLIDALQNYAQVTIVNDAKDAHIALYKG